MRKRCRLSSFYFITIILLCSYFYSCSSIVTPNENNYKTAKPDFSFKADNIMLDTLFSDSTHFVWGIKKGHVVFRWTKGDAYLDRIVESQFDLSTLKKEDTKYIAGIWTLERKYKSIEIFKTDSLLIFGYNYLPHGVCWYYVKWDNIVDYGRVCFDMKWYFPLIDENKKMIFSIHEDFEKENDSANSIIHFYGKKSLLKDLPATRTTDSICFRNSQINYGCQDDHSSTDSCSWSFLIKDYKRFKDFFESN